MRNAIPKLWIVSPVYRDVESFLKLRGSLSRLLQLDNRKIHFIAIDDTGGDDPETVRLQALSDVTVITCSFNLGHQSALVFGLRKMKEQVHFQDTVITLDADGEDQPEDVPRLLRALDQRRLHFSPVLALRTQRKESLAFKILYFCFKGLFRFLTGKTIRTGNFAVYSGYFLHRLIHHPYFDLCYSSTLIRLSTDIRYVPCVRGTRFAGKSRMNLNSLIMHGIRMLMPFLDIISIRALVGFATLFGIGMIATISLISLRVFTLLHVPQWALYSALSLIPLSIVALGNFLILFSVFSQTQGLFLSKLNQNYEPLRNSSKKAA